MDKKGLFLSSENLFELVSCKPLNTNMQDWDCVLKDIAIYDPNYKAYTIMYQTQYFSEKDEYYQDYSAIYYHNAHPVAVWSICVYKRNGIFGLGTNGGRLAMPLIADELRGSKAHKRMADNYFKLLLMLCKQYQIQLFEMEINSFLYKPGIIYEKLVLNGAITQYTRHDLYLDISLELDRIKSGLRKSYKSLIHNGMRVLSAEIIDANSTSLHESVVDFRKLHIAVAGRETRSAETWRLQELAIRNTDDFVAFLRDKTNNLIGASLIVATPTIAQYAVGAYKRELFDTYALGHVCQMIAIERLCAMGKRWYYIGQIPLPQDIPEPTSKEISIGHFKKGFSTDMVVINKLIITPNNLNKALGQKEVGKLNE